MANGTLGRFLQLLRSVGSPEEGPPSDGQLLERFAAQRDEVAFDALVERHGPMVWGVCRRVLSDPNDADDAFQATFLVLVRRARAVARQESVGSWLHGVAHRVALRAKLQANQRRDRERQAASAIQQIEPGPDPLWNEVRHVLDEELERLPEKYRAPLVLCYLEGKTNDEAADELGWTRGTIAGRLNRARELLRGRLSRRGVGIATGVLVSMFSTQTAPAAVPAGLARATLQAGLACAAGSAGAGSAAIALAEGVLTSMRISKLRMIVAVVLVLGFLGTGAGFVLREAAAQVESGTGPVQAVPAAVPVAVARPLVAPQIVHKPVVSWVGPNSAIEKETLGRITDNVEWAKLWKRHVGDKGEKDVDGKELILPRVNFDDYMVIAVFGGEVSNNLVGFSFHSMTEDNDKVVFRFRDIRLLRNFATASRPYGIFVAPRSTKRLVLERDAGLGDPPMWEKAGEAEKLAEAPARPAVEAAPAATAPVASAPPAAPNAKPIVLHGIAVENPRDGSDLGKLVRIDLYRSEPGQDARPIVILDKDTKYEKIVVEVGKRKTQPARLSDLVSGARVTVTLRASANLREEKTIIADKVSIGSSEK
jgi:RNA polymerase sigma factor (sigma-70 family)